jgi:small-conductance mechanosensitive channel
LEQLRQTALAYLPRVAGALLLLVIGWLIAQLLRWIAFRVLRRLARLGAVERELKASGFDEATPRVGAAVVFWIVFVLFVGAAGQVLGLGVVTGGLARLAQYLPSVLAAVLIMVAGAVVGNLARAGIVAAARSLHLAQPDLLGRATRITVLAVASVLAIEQLGIDSTVLVVAIGLVVGGGIGGAAIAFGFGARTAVANLIASHYLVRAYRPGQRVRIGAIEGRIVELNRGGVVVETADGQALVPAKLFEETASVRLDEAG